MAQRKRPSSEPSFEDALQKLEAIVRRLEEEEIPLDQSLKLFAEGQALARACETQLKAAENQIRQLLETGAGEIVETGFAAEEGQAEEAKTTEAADDEDEEDDGDEDEDEEKRADPAPPAPAVRPKKIERDQPLERDPDDLPF